MGVTLSQPVELTRVQRKGAGSFRAAVAEMQGWRTNHEDCHAMECTDEWGSFWVLDGHGGDCASKYCAPELAKSTSQALEKAGTLPDDDVINQCFEVTDKAFRSRVAEDPAAESGSTVVGALIRKGADGLYSVKVTNCGDSRGLIIAPPSEQEAPASSTIRTTRPVHMDNEEVPTWPLITVSIDHKPNHPVERERIEAAGGFVSQDDPARLDGNLAVSRGMGDFEYKADVLAHCGKQKVSCVPDIYEAHGLKEGTIVVLACDGLWDVMQDCQVAEYVRADLIQNENADLGVMCAKLVQKALQMQSRDNVTCMIIQLTIGNAWAKKTNRFNESDEMLYFHKLAGVGEADDDMKKQYSTFLQHCGFPDKPVPCAVSGRWFGKMFKCPGTNNVYMNRHYQKKGWTRHKNGEPVAKQARPDKGV